MNYFTPYEGNEPYIFISYAHANSSDVMRVVTDMHSRGFRIWYDEGIEVGSEWPECIAEHLSAAHLMFAFISEAYMKSDNCRREMHYALSKRIKVINVFLEPTAMTPGMEMQIGNIFALMKYSMSESVFFDRLYSAPLLNSEAFSDVQTVNAPQPGVTSGVQNTESGGERENIKPAATEADEKQRKKAEKKAEKKKLNQPDVFAEPKKRWTTGRIIALVLVVLVLAGAVTMGIIGHFVGWNERLLIRLNTPEMTLLSSDTVARFENELFEDIAREYTGLADGDIYVSDLASLTELHITSAGFFFGTAPDELYPFPADIELRDLSELRYFTGLRVLYINDQSLSALATMPALPVQTLDISSGRVTSLDGVGRLTKLRELHTGGCPIMELGDISNCLDLRLVDLTGANVHDFKPFKPLTKLSSVALSDCTISEMKTVLSLSSLTELELTNCDLRGSFFKSLDKESRLTSLSLYDCKLDSTANLDDFSSLSSLTLINTGANLDWTILRELPALTTVFSDNIDALPALSSKVTMLTPDITQ